MSYADPQYFFYYTCTIVPLVILSTDLILCFDREVECIWSLKRRIGFITVVYAMERYMTIIENVLDLVSSSSLMGCEAIVIMQNILNVLDTFAVASFTTMRVWALYGKVNKVVFLTFCCSMFIPLSNIATYARHEIIFVDDTGCNSESIGSPVGFIVSTRAMSIVTDVIVLVVTWRKTAGTWKLSREIGDSHLSLSTLLLRDGTLYFLALLLLNVVTLVLDVAPNSSLAGDSSFIQVNQAISSCLICRFILDLRSVYYQDTSGERTDAVSSIGFAVRSAQVAVTTSMIGNMGAPLRTGEFDEPGEDPEEIHFSKDPFNFGLAEGERRDDIELLGVESGVAGPPGI